MTLLNDIVSRKTEAGMDQSGLGRWTWTTIQGKEQFKTTMISAYRPVLNQEDNNSTWRQQYRFYQENRLFREPIEAFDNDLHDLLTGFLGSGHNIILGMDMNDDVRTSHLARRLQAIGLKEIVTTRHKSPPSHTTTQSEKNTNRRHMDQLCIRSILRWLSWI